MPKLADTQSLILSRASQRDDLVALPLPSRLRGAAAKKVVAPLIERGLLAEVDADPRKRGALWRQRQDGSFATLAITDAGLAAIGIEIDPPRPEPVADPVPERPAQRKGTKWRDPRRDRRSNWLEEAYRPRCDLRPVEKAAGAERRD